MLGLRKMAVYFGELGYVLAVSLGTSIPKHWESTIETFFRTVYFLKRVTIIFESTMKYGCYEMECTFQFIVGGIL